MVLDTEGSLYIVDGGGGQCRVRKVTTDGIITTFAGTGVCHNAQLGKLATDSPLYFPQGLAIDPLGALFVASTAENRIVKIDFPFKGFENDDIAIPSEDATQVYQFDPTGRHLSTVDARTGVTLQSFAYDPEGLLASVTDGDGDITRIERDLDGTPTAIVSPFGPRMTLTLHPDGMLKTLTNPEGETTQMAYRAGGLLETLTDPRSHATTFDYTPLGRLERDTDDLGGFKSLTRTGADDSYTVRVETALGRIRTYLVEDLATGDQRRVITGPGGLATEVLRNTDGTRTIAAPDGTVTTVNEGPDPRFGMQAPIIENRTIATPEGRNLVVTTTRAATLANPNNLLSLLTQTETVRVNGRAYTSVFDASTKKTTTTTPEGRETVATVDGQGRVTRTEVPAVTPTDFGYDAQGRLQTIVQGDRDYTLIYRPDGFLETITDPLSRVIRFDYDNAGRVTTQTLPDGRVIGYGYDDNGNLTSVTPPGKPGHIIDYNSVDLEEFYNPPDIGLTEDRTRYDYNLDRQIDLITRPDGGLIDFGYDAGGRLDTITTGRGVIDYDYDPVTGNLSTLTVPDETLTYTYDGSLLKATTWSGEVSGTVTRTYDNDFRVISRSVNGGDPINFGYNDDSLLTSAGALSLVRDPGNSLLDTTTLGIVTTDTDYNSFGEVESFEVRTSGSTVYKIDPFTRDDLGRIRFKTETIGGATHTYEYQYDLGGRLDQVLRDSVLTADYDYDPNGNRIVAPGLIGIPDYDDQDRLRTYGDKSYTYTDNGELLTKTGSDGTTTYGYDAMGDLTAVTLPDGTSLEYVIDGNNRRVGKKINGVLTQGFLYQDQLNPIAELDGSGNVVSHFVYGESVNVPAYIIRGGVTYRIISDHLGSPRLVINSSDGSIVQRMDYDEFGNVTLDTNPGFQPFGFAGGLYDQHAKLVRFGARDYDPETGRWTAKDPILFGGGDTNLYGYVLNDPVNALDLFGLDSWRYQNGVLEYLDDNGNVAQSWPAGSGPFGNGALPPGNYNLPGGPSVVPPSHPERASFCDASGNCWWQPVMPTFPTPREGLGIHPDGNVPGTAGCIGATGRNTQDLYDRLRQNPGLPLEVR